MRIMLARHDKSATIVQGEYIKLWYQSRPNIQLHGTIIAVS